MLVRQLEKISPANFISIGLRGLYCFQSELSLISERLHSTQPYLRLVLKCNLFLIVVTILIKFHASITEPQHLL